MFVKLGNVAAKEGLRQGEKIIWRKIQGEQVTTLSIDDRTPVDDAVTETVDAWAWHSDADPAWVESDNAELASALADHFGCELTTTKEESDNED